MYFLPVTSPVLIVKSSSILFILPAKRTCRLTRNQRSRRWNIDGVREEQQQEEEEQQQEQQNTAGEEAKTQEQEQQQKQDEDGEDHILDSGIIRKIISNY